MLTLSDVGLAQPNTTTRGLALTSPGISYQIEDLNFDRNEDLSAQCNGVNNTFVVQDKVLNVFGLMLFR